MTDTIALSGIRAFGHHGVLPHERVEGQEFVVDLELRVDLAPAAATDLLADTVDYGVLAERVVAAVQGPPVDLIETLADRIARQALLDDRVESVLVRVHKPQAPITVPFADVVVTLERRRS